MIKSLKEVVKTTSKTICVACNVVEQSSLAALSAVTALRNSQTASLLEQQVEIETKFDEPLEDLIKRVNKIYELYNIEVK